MLYQSGKKLKLTELIDSASLALRTEPGELSDDDANIAKWKKNLFQRKADTFTDNGDGTITDSVTNLMWEKTGSDHMTYDKTQAYIDNLNRKKFAGYDDWRLPTLEELASLLEDKKVNGFYINPVFECGEYGWYWTVDKRASGGAWLVGFSVGYVLWLNLDKYVCVRGVRSQTM